jgi:O-antigen/teichoic acid export membrane protein
LTGEQPPTVRRQWNAPLFQSGFALLLGSGLTSALGLPYWVLAARSYTPAEVGRGAAVLSALVLVSGATQLGLAGVLPRYLPVRSADARRIVTIAYLATLAAGATLATLAVLTVSVWSPSLRFLGHDVLWAVSFVAGVMIWNVFTIQDSVLTGIGQARWIPLENASYSVAKIALLLAFAAVSWEFGIVVSWLVPALAAAIVVTGVLLARVLQRGGDRPAPPRSAIRRAIRLSLGNYAGNLASLASGAILPVLLLNGLGARSTAAFYAAYTIAMALPLVGAAFATSFTVQAAAHAAQMRRLCRQTILGSYALLIPLVIALLLAAPDILGLFGGPYAEQGDTVLRLLSLSALPNVLVVVGLGIARIHHRGGLIAFSQGAMAIVVVGLTSLRLDSAGVDAAGTAWLIAQTLGGLFLGLKVVVPELRRPLSTGREPPDRPR